MLPAPDLSRILFSWEVQPLGWAFLVASGGLYLIGVHRYNAAHPSERFPRRRVTSFVAGLFVLSVALHSGIAAYAEVLFSLHMAQHLLVTMVAAPLLVFGTPVFVARRASSRRFRRLIVSALHSRATRLLTLPLVAWTLYVGVMWTSHLSPLYNSALEHPAVHGAEHGLYLTAAVLFWIPVLGVDPLPRRLSYPFRLLYVFLSMPANTLLGFVLYSSTRVLYPHYAEALRSWGPSPLADQRTGAVLMWLVGDLAMLAALVAVAVSWARAEQRFGRHPTIRVTADGRPEDPRRESLRGR